MPISCFDLSLNRGSDQVLGAFARVNLNLSKMIKKTVPVKSTFSASFCPKG